MVWSDRSVTIASELSESSVRMSNLIFPAVAWQDERSICFRGLFPADRDWVEKLSK